MYAEKIPSCGRNRLPKPKDFQKAIYTFDMGQNDIADGLRMLSSVQDVHAALPDIINIFAEQIRVSSTRIYIYITLTLNP